MRCWRSIRREVASIIGRREYNCTLLVSLNGGRRRGAGGAYVEGVTLERLRSRASLVAPFTGGCSKAGLGHNHSASVRRAIAT